MVLTNWRCTLRGSRRCHEGLASIHVVILKTPNCHWHRFQKHQIASVVSGPLIQWRRQICQIAFCSPWYIDLHLAQLMASDVYHQMVGRIHHQRREVRRMPFSNDQWWSIREPWIPRPRSWLHWIQLEEWPVSRHPCRCLLWVQPAFASQIAESTRAFLCRIIRCNTKRVSSLFHPQLGDHCIPHPQNSLE